jgi:hypothetical protein
MGEADVPCDEDAACAAELRTAAISVTSPRYHGLHDFVMLGTRRDFIRRFT